MSPSAFGFQLRTRRQQRRRTQLDRCVAYDRRGHGRSTAPDQGYDYDTLADDLAAVLDGLNLRNVVLAGHSMASGELVRYITRHGTGRVSKLIFLAPMAAPYATRTAASQARPTSAPSCHRSAYRRSWRASGPSHPLLNSPHPRPPVVRNGIHP